MTHVCPQCKGTGQLTTKLYEGFPGATTQCTEHSITCVTCQGHKRISDSQYKEYMKEQDMWCTCKDHINVTYYPDNTHPFVKKHCWVCSKCNKIVQIG